MSLRARSRLCGGRKGRTRRMPSCFSSAASSPLSWLWVRGDLEVCVVGYRHRKRDRDLSIEQLHRCLRWEAGYLGDVTLDVVKSGTRKPHHSLLLAVRWDSEVYAPAWDLDLKRCTAAQL